MIKPNSILYVELKTGYHGNGPAWIGRARCSKSGKSLYFDGKILKGVKNPAVPGNSSGNYYDIVSGNKYWVSGAKKGREDRLGSASGNVFVDRAVLKDYLARTGLESLPATQYAVVDLKGNDVRDKVAEQKK